MPAPGHPFLRDGNSLPLSSNLSRGGASDVDRRSQWSPASLPAQRRRRAARPRPRVVGRRPGVGRRRARCFRRSFEVVSYDRRGHSRSSCPPGQGSVRDDVDDLAALIEALDLGPAHVAGASLGGSIALRLAAARPELVRSVAVHEPPLFDLLRRRGSRTGPSWPSCVARLATVASGSSRATRRARLGSTSTRWPQTPGGWAGLDPGAARACSSPTLPPISTNAATPRRWASSSRTWPRSGARRSLTHGDRRPPLFRRIVEMVAAAMPGARSEPIPGTAHDPQVTHPDRLRPS